MKKRVRVRIAPSPTGDPHVGTAYTALFNYVFAKSQGGDFILRIEDTDRARSTKESEEEIFKALKWLGINWDEGPDKPGKYGPYRQSERFDIYREHAKKLIDSGKAYYCFCSTERLAELRKQQQLEKKRTKYDSKCLLLPKKEIEENLKKGLPHVVRMVAPKDGACKFKDLLRGDISIDYETIDDQILIKSDGYPTYHLANVVDDHLMGISHVLRGEEWINSAPKHLLLYSYFNWEAPVLCHLPLLRNPDKSKLSKRKNPTSINYYKRMGFLPEALLNFLGLMGWAMPDEKEKFSLNDMVENFDVAKISLGGPIFDLSKLRWLNGRYIRENRTEEELFIELKKWRINDEFIKKIIPLTQKRMLALSDFVPMVQFLFAGELTYNSADFLFSEKTEDEVKEILQLGLWELEKLKIWEKNALYELFKNMSDAYDLKLKQFFIPFYLAITGKKDSLPLFDVMELLGSDVCRFRISQALLSFSEPGLSGKKLKKLEKKYKTMFQENS